MKKISIKLILALLCIFTALPSVAAEFRGKATISVKGSWLSSKPTREEFEKARAAALLDAWRAYLSSPNAGMSMARLRIIEDNKAELERNLDQYFSNISYLESSDEKTKTYTVVVIANINDQKISEFISRKSVAGQQASGDGSNFVFLFLQRNANSNYQVKDVRSAEIEANTSAQSDDTSAGVKQSASTKKSQTNVRDKAKFSGDKGAGDVGARVNQELTQNGFEATDFKDIADYCDGGSLYDEAMDGYEKTGNLQNFSGLVSLVKECGKKNNQQFKFFAVGEMEASAPTRAHNKQEIVVTLRIRVVNIEKSFPKTVASVGPIQLIGEGEDSATATRDGLNRSAAAASKVIVDTLNQKRQN